MIGRNKSVADKIRYHWECNIRSIHKTYESIIHYKLICTIFNKY